MKVQRRTEAEGQLKCVGITLDKDWKNKAQRVKVIEWISSKKEEMSEADWAELGKQWQRKDGKQEAISQIWKNELFTKKEAIRGFLNSLILIITVQLENGQRMGTICYIRQQTVLIKYVMQVKHSSSLVKEYLFLEKETGQKIQ